MHIHNVHTVHSQTVGAGPRGQMRRGAGRGGGPGGRGPYRGKRRGRGGRVRVSRGDVRNAVLLLLAGQPMHGYQVMQELEERSGGAWQPSPGSVYPTLQQLSDEALIASDEGDSRNVYSLTAAGREAVEAIEGPPAWERFAGDDHAGIVDARHGLYQLGQAVKQVMADGDKRQVEAANEVLREARRSIYRLLAEDDEGTHHT